MENNKLDLWLHDSNDIKTGTFLIYPRMFEHSSITGILLSQSKILSKEKALFIVTNSIDKIASEYRNNNIKNVHFVLYSDINTIPTLESYGNFGTVIIDDIEELTEDYIDHLFEVLLRGHKVIIYITYGDIVDKIRLVESKIKNLLIIRLDLGIENSTLAEKVQISTISNKQGLVYLKSPNWEAASMISNYYYPDGMREFTFSEKNVVCGAEGQMYTNLPEDDIINMNGWMTTDTIRNLGDDSPKLRQLISLINLNLNTKHIILTRFEERYGTKLISGLLKLMNVKNIILSCNDSFVEYRKKINNFNSWDTGVLITNEIPDKYTRIKTEFIHIVDTYNPNSLIRLYDICYKRNLIKNGMLLKVMFYVCDLPVTTHSSIDRKQFVDYEKAIAEYDQLYELLIGKAQILKLDSRGLVIE
jgi:hypothetical protein